MSQRRLLGSLVVMLMAAAAAQPRDVSVEAMGSERRVALVMGNAAYAESPLTNPANDARAMAKELRAQGFDVIERVNADATTMRRAAAEFGERMREGGVGLFYYSGHGMQVNGRNYLIPIGAQIRSEAYVSAEALDVDSVLGQMDGARSRINIVILDACRNNPFARRFRSQTRGLAFMQAPLGTFIAYATSPGDVADDGPAGDYGIFTGELIKALREPLKIEDMFKRVGLAVQLKTQRRQTPWIASNLTGEFSFAGATVASAARAERPTPLPTGSSWVLSRRATGSYGANPDRLTVRFTGEQMWRGQRVRAYVTGTVTSFRDTTSNAFVGLARGTSPIESADPPIGFDWPIFVGKTWTHIWRYTHHDSGRTFDGIRTQFTVEAYEEVTVPAGSFKVFRVTGDDGGGYRDTAWWSPDLGINVKFSAERKDAHFQGPGTLTLELVSYDIRQ